MNISCPYCQKILTVPEQFAGQQMKCPLCEGAFTVPAMSAAGSASAEVYSLGPPPPPNPPPEIAPAESLSTSASTPPKSRPTPSDRQSDRKSEPTDKPTVPPAGYQGTLTLWISPRVVSWIAPAALTLTFFLLFFPWVGTYQTLGEDSSPTTRTGWGIGFGPDWTPEGAFYVLTVLLTLGLTAAQMLEPLIGVQLPKWAKRFWPYRTVLVSALALVAFLLLTIQLVNGFGLEQAIQRPALKEVGLGAAGSKVDENLLARLTAYRTIWLRLTFVCHVIALAGLALDSYLQRRGNRPLPRIELHW